MLIAFRFLTLTFVIKGEGGKGVHGVSFGPCLQTPAWAQAGPQEGKTGPQEGKLDPKKVNWTLRRYTGPLEGIPDPEKVSRTLRRYSGT